MRAELYIRERCSPFYRLVHTGVHGTHIKQGENGSLNVQAPQLVQQDERLLIQLIDRLVVIPGDREVLRLDEAPIETWELGRDVVIEILIAL